VFCTVLRTVDTCAGVHRPWAADGEGRHIQLRRASPRDHYRSEEPQLGGLVSRRPLTHGTGNHLTSFPHAQSRTKEILTN
jgi:hypothetical protein